MAAAVPKDSALMPWEASGTYLESCNCEAICPCRRIGGEAGGRSTYGECIGALSWQIESGHAGPVDLAGLRVVVASRYHDDEPGSPWTFVLYLDERAGDEQREALTEIYTGHLGGTPMQNFPWAFKPSELLAVRPVHIEIDHTPGRGWFRAGKQVTLRVAGRVEEETTVTCVIPGHNQPGHEIYAEVLEIEEENPLLSAEFRGRCGFQSVFAYSSSDG